MGAASSWRALAACAGLDADLFHSQSSQRAALACCASCPVAEPCLFTALVAEAAAGGRRAGIWGGTTTYRRTLIDDHLFARHLDAAELLATETAWWSAKLAIGA